MNALSFHEQRSRCAEGGPIRDDSVSAVGVDRTMSLERGEFLSIELPAGAQLTLANSQGRLWVTLEGDAQDYVLAAGEFQVFGSAGLLVVEALERSHLHISVDAEEFARNAA